MERSPPDNLRNQNGPSSWGFMVNITGCALIGVKHNIAFDRLRIRAIFQDEGFFSVQGGRQFPGFREGGKHVSFATPR